MSLNKIDTIIEALRYERYRWKPARRVYIEKKNSTKIYDQYGVRLEVDGKQYKGLQVVIPREGKEPLVATWGGIALTWDREADLEDQPQRAWGGRTELEKRLLAQVCELCGTTHMIDKIKVHHLRALKDLNRYTG